MVGGLGFSIRILLNKTKHNSSAHSDYEELTRVGVCSSRQAGHFRAGDTLAETWMKWEKESHMLILGEGLSCQREHFTVGCLVHLGLIFVEGVRWASICFVCPCWYSEGSAPSSGHLQWPVFSCPVCSHWSVNPCVKNPPSSLLPLSSSCWVLVLQAFLHVPFQNHPPTVGPLL